MKINSTLLAVLMLFVADGSAFAQPKIKTDITSMASYRMRVSLFDRLTEHRNIVMLGDSITARGEWSELTESRSIANRGIGGDTTKGILSRLDSIIKMQPNAIFIMVGINDLAVGYRPPQIVRNYKEVVERLSGKGRKIFIQSTLYTSRQTRLHHNKYVVEINEAMRSYCESSGKCEYIDLNEWMSSGGMIKPSNTGDGIHLTGEGYKEWAKALAPYILSIPE
ncbi:GDSL-type esterase/lipase family protein [Pseudomonas guariconensis]|uniref:GDSL-type esterase/lipase family protein n=1 Tax=Pseudomonas guariconensis TaxID=1288410 RepID=UPI00209B41F4|nr:GDSL-type esterase/lipase family protein [Pseudomonas guariconensis]MCO7630558.1 GDSL-type esterase/lipase family protein [Pseudomonas guariconensis]